MSNETTDKIQIFFTSSNEFGYGEVVYFQAKTGSTASVLIVNRNEALLPSFRQHSSFFADAMRVITESLVERRGFADTSVDEISISRTAKGKQIGFDRNGEIIGGSGN